LARGRVKLPLFLFKTSWKKGERRLTENSLSLEKGQGGNGGSPARGRRRSTFPFPLLWALFLTVSLYYLFPFFFGLKFMCYAVSICDRLGPQL